MVPASLPFGKFQHGCGGRTRCPRPAADSHGEKGDGGSGRQTSNVHARNSPYHVDAPFFHPAATPSA